METTLTPQTITRSRLGNPRTVKKLVSERLREVMAKQVSREFEAINQAQIELAKGGESVRLLKDGTELIVKVPADVNAARLLYSYVLGEPKQEIKHTGAIGIVQLVAQLEHGDVTA